MLYAAGLGTRMGSLTSNTPKPLLKAGERPLIYWSLDLAQKYGFEKVVINIHYQPDQMIESINNYKHNFKPNFDILFSFEEERLDTGGGLKKAAKFFDNEMVFTLNTDTILFPKSNPFEMLENMAILNTDMVMLLQPANKVIGDQLPPQFDLDPSKNIINNPETNKYIFTGLQIIKLDLVTNYPEDIFSNSVFHHSLVGTGKIKGIVNEGNWCHANTPEGYNDINKYLLETETR